LAASHVWISSAVTALFLSIMSMCELPVMPGDEQRQPRLAGEELRQPPAEGPVTPEDEQARFAHAIKRSAWR
jgi:hypothetical protein